MKQKITAAVLLMAACYIATAQNYVKTKTYLNSSSSDYITEYQYYDGLGRPSQKCTNGLGTSGNYVSTLTTYDKSGREQRKYLPAVIGTSPAYLTEAAFRTYSSSMPNYDAYAYSENEYDGIDRLTATGGAGTAWHYDDRKVRKTYGTNGSSEVKYYYAFFGLEGIYQTTYYPAGTLERETTFDEDENRIDVWRDVAGRIVMENREGRKTYYVYDERSFLRYVLQPKYQQEASLSKYAFQYLYDSNGHCIMKTLPGCEYIAYIYDDCNRVAYMQDGVMRDLGKYRFTFYDQMGRIAIQGICTQPRADGASATVTYSNSTAGICSTGWSLPSGASLGTTTLEQANYYDDYSFLSSSAFSGSGLTSLTGGNAMGLLTGTLSLTSNNVTICSVNYYDDKGRLTSRQQTLPFSRKLRTDTQYTFTSKASRVTETVTSGSDTYSLDKNYTYSLYNDRATSLYVAYGGFLDDEAAGYEYNDLGRLSKITRPDACDTQYTYNQQGWLTGISNTEFSQWLYYADGGYPAYNGNLGKMEWKYGNGSVRYCYDFQYENNQLTDAYYYLSSGASTNRYGMTADYDNNGNVTSLLRYGRLDNASYGLIDNLTYTYNGNQLLSVTDGVDGPNYTGAFHFIDRNTSGSDYEYDKNGNLKKDKNKNILSIQYNLLNLPTSMALSNYNTANWTYDAQGTKLRSTFFSMSPYVYYNEDYCGSFVFRDNELERVHFDEGYITLEGNNTQKLHYYLKDHQGNVRLVVENGPNEQTNEYYPYGGLTYNSDLTNTVQPYKYNGKELDRIHGLDMYDYGARQYDPNIGRFTQMDPMAEKYYHLSPYAYCGNNPVNFVDPNGEEPTAKEAALMAAYVYGGKSAILYGEKLKEENWIVSSFNTSIKMNYSNWFSNGLESVLFEKTLNGVTEYAYVFAGTNSLEDIAQDVTQLFGFSSQYSVAIANAKQLSIEVGKNELTFVGHSLGGGEATAASMATGRAAITFNSAKVSLFTSHLYGLGNNGNVTNYRTLGKSLGVFGSFGGDPVSNIQDKLFYLKSVGTTKYVPIGVKDPFSSHSIKVFLNYFSR